MLNRLVVVVGVALLVGGCDGDDTVFLPDDSYPAPPLSLGGSYFKPCGDSLLDSVATVEWRVLQGLWSQSWRRFVLFDRGRDELLCRRV